MPPKFLNLFRLAVVYTIFSAPASLALAETEPTSEVALLRAQVAELKALVTAQHDADIQKISTLTAELETLKGEVGPHAPGRDGTAQAAPVADAARQPDDRIGVPRVVQNSAHRLALQSADGQYAIGFSGNLQIDLGAYDIRPGSAAVAPQTLANGLNARRARIGVVGSAPGGWGFAFVYDAGNSSDQTPKGIETAQLVYGGLKGAAFEFGYSNTYFTLDQATSSNDTLFLERSSASNIATNINTGDSRSNAGVRLFGDRYWVGGYLTGPASGDSHTVVAERFGAFERAAFQVLKGPDYSLHLGLGFDQLFQASNSGAGTPATLTLSDQPELRIDPTQLLSATVGSAANPVRRASVLDIETAGTLGPLFWQGEYYAYQVERSGLKAADFTGAYGQLSWSLTGEQHAYNPQAAAYYRLVPRTAFDWRNGTWGAWEVAARIDYVDLDSHFIAGQALSALPAAVDGGRQRGLSLGLNWYPNDIIRVLLDYNHVTEDKLTGVVLKGSPLGAQIGARLDAVAVRVQAAY